LTAAGVGYFTRDKLIRWALGSNDDYYTQLEWDRVSVPKERQPKWQWFNRDPNMTSENPSDFEYLGLVSVRAQVFDDALREANAVQATAWRVSDDTMDIGTMHTGQSFFSQPVNDPSRYVIGQRIGGNDLSFTPGGRKRANGEFFVPEGAEPLPIARFRIVDLQADFPGVIYV
jgi:hypothetical protein